MTNAPQQDLVAPFKRLAGIAVVALGIAAPLAFQAEDGDPQDGSETAVISGSSPASGAAVMVSGDAARRIEQVWRIEIAMRRGDRQMALLSR